MNPDTPIPTPAERKFDRAQEEAFSNEGAPPLAGANVAAADDARSPDDEAGLGALTRGSSSAKGQESASMRAIASLSDGPRDAVAKDAAGRRRVDGPSVGRVCLLLSGSLPGRGN